MTPHEAPPPVTVSIGSIFPGIRIRPGNTLCSSAALLTSPLQQKKKNLWIIGGVLGDRPGLQAAYAWAALEVKNRKRWPQNDLQHASMEFVS
jgi:hypothetical protein